MPSETELWMVAFELARRHGVHARVVAASWQAEFLRSDDEILSSTWGEIRKMVVDLQLPGPRNGEIVQ